MNNTFQNLIRSIEVGKLEVITRLVPFFITLGVIALLYNFGPVNTPLGPLGGTFRGLSDSQSMDTMQLARQIATGQGYTTKFIRPYALKQLRDQTTLRSLADGGSPDLFPASLPAEAPRVVPDTYNAPGYPYLLAAFFKVIHPNFNQGFKEISESHYYTPERLLPPINTIFMLMTAGLVFLLGYRLFDDRVAWLALCAFVLTNLMWQFTLTALSTSFLMLLVTAIMCCVVEIYCVGEACFQSEEHSFGMGWVWALVLALLLAVACLTRLHLIVLLIPLALVFGLMPQARAFLPVMIALIVVGAVIPWFWHMYRVTGNPLGSNLPLLLYGADPAFAGNQIYCSTTLLDYNSTLMKYIVQKEFQGCLFHFQNAWQLLGSSPLIILFAATLVHRFKRPRAQMLQWLTFGCLLVIMAVNNLGVSDPDVVSAWNNIVLLFPVMLVIGSAFFFIQFDRLDIQIGLVKGLIIIGVLVATSFPMLINFTTPRMQFYAYPPYMPPLIKVISQFAKPNEWVTSDMPWATAWYGDRASLWLPDSLTEFTALHDNVCPTGVLLFTPVTWLAPLDNIINGEQKEWAPFITKTNLPPNFPLRANTPTPPGGPNYSIWCDRPRWNMQ